MTNRIALGGSSLAIGKRWAVVAAWHTHCEDIRIVSHNQYKHSSLYQKKLVFDESNDRERQASAV